MSRPSGADQADRERDDHRLLDGLAGRRRHRSARRRADRSAPPRRSVPVTAISRRAGLRVPAHELREVACRSRRRSTATNSSTVAAWPSWRVEVEVHAVAEAAGAEQRLQHAHDLGALLVDGRRVEVVDLVIDASAAPDGRGGRRPRGTGGRAGARTSPMRFDRARALVGGEFLVAEDGQAFLQAELEPVAAGDAVAGPVVEILVRDDGLDRGVVGVGRGLGLGQHVACR